VGRPRPVKAAQPAARSTDLLRLWAFSDPHVGTDKRFGRLSLAESLRQSEFGGADGGPPFEWEIAVNLGDMSGGQAVPVDEEGEEAVRQFSALRKHRREDIYSLAGNHDRSGLDEPQNWWWRKWIDPTGEHTEHSGVDPSRRPYPIQGTWEHYSFRVGNILFLMMSDINEPTQKVGRGTLGGNPGGVVSGETFAWWRKMVGANQHSIIISAHHYMLKDTTVASGEWEGCRQKEDGTWVSHYHGYKARGTPKGASYLYWVDSVPDAQAFESYLAAHPGAIDMWLGGHTHTHPDDTYGNKSHIETKWGVHFINVAALTSRHAKTSVPMSRPLTIHGDELRVQCYMHTSDYAPQGWYAKAERNLKLNKRFHR
jgi:hypothetical protein